MTEFEKLNEQAARLHEQLTALNEEMEKRGNRRDELENEIRSLREQRRTLRAELREHPENEPALREQIETLDLELGSLHQQLDTQDDLIEEIEGEIEEIGEELAQIRDKITEMERKGDNDPGLGFDDLGRRIASEVQKYLDRIRKIDFNKLGENISRTVDSAVDSASRSFAGTRVFQDDESGLPNQSFAGAGTLNGGDYGKLSFAGAGKISGNITCKSLKSSGALSAKGDVLCSGEIRSTGSLKTSGNVQAETLFSSGSVRIEGGFDGGIISVPGSLDLGKSVRAQEVQTSGSLVIGGDCETEKFISSGRVTIEGLLNAGSVEIRLGGSDSRIGSIGCETLRVLPGRSMSSIFQDFLDDLGIESVEPSFGTLHTESIEGDTLDLTNVEADVVRGTHITLGPGCKIGLVEYTGTYTASENAEVGEVHILGGESSPKSSSSENDSADS